MRYVPDELLSHLKGSARTTCWLLKLILKNGDEFGMTTLDRDVEYMGVNYSSNNGFDQSKIVTEGSYSVNNSQPKALLSISGDIPGITEQMIGNGQLDDAEWQLMLVNYENLDMGHVLIGEGDVGQVNMVDGVMYMPELLDIMMRLRQPIGHFTSRSCRAIFGSMDVGQTMCGFPADNLWVHAYVTAVSDEEPRRVFADGNASLSPFPTTARVRWYTGKNAGNRLYQVEAYDPNTGTISLIEPTSFPISIGDEYHIRPDCDKSPGMCRMYNNWIHFKGENLIPGEGTGLSTPGSSVY